MTFDLASARPWYDLSGAEPIAPDYGPSILVPTTALTSELRRRLSDCLTQAGTDWVLTDALEPSSTVVVTPLAPLAPGVLRPDDPVREPADVAAVIRAYGGTAVPDVVAKGAPAGKPNAVTRGDLGRVPVTVVARPPARRDPDALPGGRRPVVALLDTLVDGRAGTPAERPGDEPWLGESSADGPWVNATEYGWRWPKNPPMPTLDLQVYTGHGTFSAGLIRQVAPDARILSVPVMHSDGAVWADHLINAFGWLYEKAKQIEGFVDIVCCPITVEAVLPADQALLGWLRRVVGALGELGVQVVVAAGNTGSETPTFPGGFTASSPDSLPAKPVISVGALNPNGTKAYYSARGDWVSVWERGTSVVSLFPPVSGLGNPEVGPSEGFESLDPDHFTGWARWSGTSFAAAIHAGKLARQLTERPL